MECSWDHEISELRVCFLLSTALAVVLGINALIYNKRKNAQVFIQSSYFFVFIFVMMSTFELFAVRDAKNNNKDVCTLSGAFEMEKRIEGERLKCNYNFFSNTALYSNLCSFPLLLSSLQVKNWLATSDMDDL